MYAPGSKGYRGRIFANEVGARRFPRRDREEIYQGLGARDWAVASAYFAFASQSALKLRIGNKCPNCMIEPVLRYLDNRESVWKAMGDEYVDGEGRGGNYSKRVVTSVFHGSAITEGRAENVFVQGISKCGCVSVNRGFLSL